MGFDDVASLVSIGVVLVLAIACLVAVAYVRWVDGQRKEKSRYLDMLVQRDTRVGAAQADLLVFIAYVLCRLWFPESVPSIGPGWSSLWLTSVFLLMGWGPVQDALQFKRDRAIGRQGGAE